MSVGPPPKIAFFIPGFAAGGAERVAIHIANALVGMGYAVDFVVLQANGPFFKLVSPGVNVVVLNKSRVLLSILALASYFRYRSPTVVISFMNYVNVVAIISRVLSFKKIKMIVSEHSMMSQAETSNARTSAFIVKALCSALYGKADAVIAVSNVVRHYLLKELRIPPEKIILINNPVDICEVRKKCLIPNFHPWCLDDSVPMIISVGRLSAEKNFPLLIRAFLSVRDNLRARLVILGEGPERLKLESIIQSSRYPEDCLLQGFQENPYNWLSRANLFVSSSDSEAFGNVLIESLACNTRVVTTLNSGVPLEILENGKWGVIVDNGDVDKLADAIRIGLTSKREGDLSVRAEDFDIGVIARKYQQLIETVIRRSP